MDKVINAGHLLMKRYSVVVPNNIVVDVLTASGTEAKAPALGGPKADSTPRGAPA
jgi:hypothetical protein